MRHATILVAILAFVPLASATAQVQPPPVERGAQVRITIPPSCPASYTSCTGLRPRQRVGTFLAWKADSLVMESNGDTLAVSLDSVTTFEVRPVERSIGTAAMGGLLLGALIGGVVGWAVGLDTERSVEQKLQKFCSGDAIISGPCRTRIVPTYKERKVVSPEAVVIGAAAGGLLGLLTGVAIASNRWVAVSPGRLGLNVGPQRDGRFGLGASVRF